MKKIRNGVPKHGTPIFLCNLLIMLFCCCLVWAPFLQAEQTTEASATSGSIGNTKTGSQKIIISADQISYYETPGHLKAEGNVRIWFGDITMTAQEAEADLSSEVVFAKGSVELTEKERSIKCAQLEYNLKNQSAKATGILFATYPWYYQGKAVEKTGEKHVVISEPSFTTCNARQPHYHLKAKKIEIELGDYLVANDVTLYIGTTPVFYFPWVHRSLKDSRPPFSIKLGYNDFEGFFAKLSYNYFFADQNYGSIKLDLMEKKGVGTGLDHHFEYQVFGKGTSDLSFLYINDTEEEKERITGKINSEHEFTKKDVLKINLDYLSDRNFNREFSSALVDTFQQRSNITYSHRGDTFYFSAGAQEILSLDPILEKYYTSTRELPSLNFSLNSRKLFHLFKPVYFSLSSSVRRTFPRKQVTNSSTSVVEEFYRYEDAFSVSPSLRQTYTLPLWVTTQPSFSWSVSAPITGNYKEHLIEGVAEDDDGNYADLDAAYTTQLSMTNKWVNYRYTKPTHLLKSQLTHELTRKFSILEESTLAHAGITNHRLRLKVDYDMGGFFYVETSSAYNLLLEQKQIVNWYDPLDNPSFSGRLMLFDKYSLNWQGNYSWEDERISNATVSASTYGNIWNASVNTSYTLRTLYDNSGNPYKTDSVYLTLNGGFRPKNWGLALQSSLQYDFDKQQFTNFSISAARSLHCWQMQASFKIYADGNTQMGLGINLKAFPEMKIGNTGDGIAFGE